MENKKTGLITVEIIGIDDATKKSWKIYWVIKRSQNVGRRIGFKGIWNWD